MTNPNESPDNNAGGQPFGAPQYGNDPQYPANPQYGASQYGSPQYGSAQYGSPQYGAAPGYGAPQYGYQGGAPGVEPDNNLVWAILSTVLCCLPLGIVSIVKATSVSKLWAIGDYAGAQRAADDAKKFAIWSAVASVVVWVILVIVYVVIIAAAVSTSTTTTP
ncbi:CD225/dispanin family protein [Gordonia sp. LUNF6]|uniref:CD225/dispanin family protein n=1 Tax=Gordonia TaxID=2053 RepID=UPI0024164975|nr:CD225/dispanin family protein [Gordonia sihwensis]WFN92198.1 CD225/dispanin family protein [Gordonia sihwensis]